MNMDTLKDFYVEQLRDLYSTETQMVDLLPKLADAASNTELKERFRLHQAETRRHAERLERIFEQLGTDAVGHRCKGMEGIIRETEEMLGRLTDAEVRDVALIAAQQRMEHYEIAGYGCVRSYARLLDLPEHQRLLQDTLNEEGQTDHELTGIAQHKVNPEADENPTQTGTTRTP